MSATAEAPETQSSAAAPQEAMAWDSKARRMVTIYLPLACFLIILLFPFYWMTITSFKPNAELYDYKTHNPFWITSPTLDHIRLLLFNTAYPRWLMTTMMVAIGATVLSLVSSTLAAYAIQRLRFKGSQYVGLGIYLAYLVPPSALTVQGQPICWAWDLPCLSGTAFHPVHPARDHGVSAWAF